MANLYVPLCRHCDPPAQFPTRSAIQAHNAVQHMGHPIECIFCGMAFENPLDRDEHVNDVHELPIGMAPPFFNPNWEMGLPPPLAQPAGGANGGDEEDVGRAAAAA